MIKAIVTDIEGTTSSIRFVHDVLFPYAKAHIAEFVRGHCSNNGSNNDSNNDEVRVQLNEVAELSGIERSNVDGLIQQLLSWIERDEKITPLKTLQGMIWENGYQQGHFKGHVYDDAAAQLKQWSEQGIDLYVYSSGSVKAQKLIFGYSEHGDLTPLFKGYFDTRIGGKRDVESYEYIVNTIGVNADEILFLSDIEQELEAATKAGIKTYWLIREADSDANYSRASESYSVTKSFDRIVF